MIVQNLTPEVYYNESRDFSFIGRLIEIAFNYMKTGADCIRNDLDPKGNGNSNIVELVTSTLGFESKHEYITKDLVYIANAFTDLLRNKGTKYAILTAIRLLLNSQGLHEDVAYDAITVVDQEIIIKIPQNLSDIILLEDLFDYILPAGYTYKFITVDSFKTQITNNIFVTTSDSDYFIASVPSNYTAKIKYSSSQKLPEDIAGVGAAENVDTHLGNIRTGTVYRPQEETK